MMRIVLAMIAFVLTFGSSVTIMGLLFGLPEQVPTSSYRLRTDSSTAYKIRSILRRDVHVNGTSRDRKIRSISGFRMMSESELYQNRDYRLAVVKYVNQSSSMRVTGLPEDFQYAWRQHMKAWQKQATYLQQISDGQLMTQGSIVGGYSDNTNEINQSWYQVLRIARRYGVKIDGSYYH